MSNMERRESSSHLHEAAWLWFLTNQKNVPLIFNIVVWIGLIGLSVNEAINLPINFFVECNNCVF